MSSPAGGPFGSVPLGQDQAQVKPKVWHRSARLALPAEGFTLQRGGTLNEINLVYETYGTLNDNADNAVLVVHALTGDAHVARHDRDDEAGWWDRMVGPKAPLDTDELFVISINVLGGCQGSTSPASIHPETGRPYGLSFPIITIRDMVRSQALLLEQLGIRKLRAVIGGSMGGMQALEWAIEFPNRVDAAVVIAAPGRTSAQSIAWNEVGRQAILSDPNFKDGNYYGSARPAAGLAIARMVAMITYNSYASMERKFDRRTLPVRTDPVYRRIGTYGTQLPIEHPMAMQFQVESYLHYQGEKLVRRFDANSYLYLTQAMDLHDVGLDREGGYTKALSRVRCPVCVVGITSDLLYPLGEQQLLAADLREAGVRVTLEVLDSPNGHDAFLIEQEEMGDILARFLHEAWNVGS